MSIKPGIRLGDRYQLLAPIATGGMGQVWRAEDTTLHRVVAAKILRSEFTGDETFLARFRAEARNTASLSHPNIASVYDYGEQVHDSERLCYLVMELVEGKPLVDILARERRLSPDRTLDYLEQTASGLAAAHRENMVHRDIKPGNLIIRPDGVLKITDFGIARAANSVALTERGTVVGTAQYLAPEQAEGKPANPASDIYALGVVGYECLAGFRPFDGDNSVAIALAQIREAPRPLPADVPPNVRALIEISMRKNPNARYEDGAAYIPVVRAVRAGSMPAPPVARGAQPPGPGAVPAAPPPARLPGQPAAPLPPGGPPRSGPRPPAGRGGYPAAGPIQPSVGPAGAGPAGAGPAGAGPAGTVPGPAPQSRPASRPAAPGAGVPQPGSAGPGPAVGQPSRPLAQPGPAGLPGPGNPPVPGVQPAPGVQPGPGIQPGPGGQPGPGKPPAASQVGPSPGTTTLSNGSQQLAPVGTGTFVQSPTARSGSYPAIPGPQAGTGTYATGSNQAPPGAPGADTRKVAWFWIALGLLLIAAIISLVVVLITDSGDTELTGSPLVTIMNTDLKEAMR